MHMDPELRKNQSAEVPLGRESPRARTLLIRVLADRTRTKKLMSSIHRLFSPTSRRFLQAVGAGRPGHLLPLQVLEL